MKVKLFLRILLLSISLLAVTLFSLLHLQQTSQAQGGVITLTKVLNKDNPQVRVGELISFTIVLTNDAVFSLTNVNLVDTYNLGGSNVLRFAQAIPPADQVDPATGLISWTNVATPPILPGASLSFTLFFTVEHPEDGAVVNRVQALDVAGGGTSGGFAEDEDQADEAIGGNAPLFKSLHPPDAIPEAGLPVTFTHLITNDGLALMTVLPLSDTYDATILQFNFAIPTPTFTSPGQLVWDDLTTHFGDLPSMGTVVVTTVFTALTAVDSTTNQASTAGAHDEYDNVLAPGEASVPIFVVESSPTPTPTSIPQEEDDDDDDDDDDDGDDQPATPVPAPATPTATPVAVAAVSTVTPTATLPVLEPTATATPTPSGPQHLPETGHRSGGDFLLLLTLVTLGLILARFALNRVKG